MSEELRAKPRLSRGLFYMAVIGLILLGIAGFILSQRGGESAVNIAHDDPRPLPVNTREARYDGSLLIHEQYTGLVAARRSSALGFETGGRVERIHVDVGDVISTGKVLAELDVRTLKANLSAAKAQIAEAEASLKLARATVERQKALEEKGLLSAQRYDEAAAQADAARARLNAANAQVEALNVQLQLSELRAPFDGVVTRRFMDEGTIAAPGSPVVQIVESSVLEISIGLPSELARALTVGEDYDLKIEGERHAARLRSLTGVIEASQRTVTAVFDLHEGDTSVYPGAVARLEIERELSQSGFWIPVSAMTEADRGLWSVYVVTQNADGDTIVEKRLVDLLHAEASQAFVRGPLEDGDLFVADGLHRLTAGMKVEPVSRSASE